MNDSSSVQIKNTRIAIYIRIICAFILFNSEVWSAPGLTYSTYLSKGFTPAAIATDAAGNVYLAGSTYSTDALNPGGPAIVVKVNGAGSQYISPAFAQNADGTVNSCSKRAAAETVISLFVNGLGVVPKYGYSWSASNIPVLVSIGGWSAEVVNITAPSPFVWKVDVTVPAAVSKLSSVFFSSVSMDMNVLTGVTAVGPLSVSSSTNVTVGTPLTLDVWVNP